MLGEEANMDSVRGYRECKCKVGGCSRGEDESLDDRVEEEMGG